MQDLGKKKIKKKMLKDLRDVKNVNYYSSEKRHPKCKLKRCVIC